MSALQQHLPFTVLKRYSGRYNMKNLRKLQQHLPFTVLKRHSVPKLFMRTFPVATAPTVYGIET